MRLVSKRMMMVKIAIAVFIVSAWLFAFSSTPPPGVTGGFGESTCHVCHSSFDPPEEREPIVGGDFYLDNVPEAYVPGQVYRIEVVIQHPGQSRWGYELAVRDENGEQAGDIRPDDISQVQTSADGIQYLSHTREGTFAGLADGPVVWHFDWRAPGRSVRKVFFHAAGIAANNDGSPSGDYVYRTEAVTVPVAQAE